MPSQAAPTSHITTHAKNADTHPGIVEPKQKCRNKAEIEADKKAAQEAKDAVEAKKKAGLTKIAKLEERMEQDNANNATPRPKPVPRRALRRTYTVADLTAGDRDTSEPPTDAPTDVDEFQATTESELSDVTETEQPAKKKMKESTSKAAKPKVWDMINAVRKESTSTKVNNVEGKRVDAVELPPGKKTRFGLVYCSRDDYSC